MSFGRRDLYAVDVVLLSRKMPRHLERDATRVYLFKVVAAVCEPTYLPLFV